MIKIYIREGEWREPNGPAEDARAIDELAYRIMQGLEDSRSLRETDEEFKHRVAAIITDANSPSEPDTLMARVGQVAESFTEKLSDSTDKSGIIREIGQYPCLDGSELTIEINIQRAKAFEEGYARI